MDPRTWLGLLTAVGILAIALDNPLSLGILAATTLLALLATRASRLGFQVIGVVLAVVWSTTLSQGLFYGMEPRTPLFSLAGLVVYREGALHGLVQSLRMVAVTLMGICVALAVPTDRLAMALVRLHVPHGLAFLSAAALRFLPQVVEDLATVRRARAGRGRALLRRSPWAWLRLEVSLVRPVVARSLRRARTLAESLDARGFDPLRPSRPRHPLVMGWGERAILVLAGVLVLVVTGARAVFTLYTAEVLYLPWARPLYNFVRHHM